MMEIDTTADIDEQVEAIIQEVQDAQEFLPPAKAEFHVTDESSANWVLGKLLDCDEEEARIKAWYKSAMQEVERKREFFENRFGGELEAYAAQALAESKSKSLKLPNGSIGFRSSKPGLVIVDEARVDLWASIHAPHILNVVTTLSKSRLKEYYEATGEIPDGADLGETALKFYISKPRGMKGTSEGGGE